MFSMRRVNKQSKHKRIKDAGDMNLTKVAKRTNAQLTVKNKPALVLSGSKTRRIKLTKKLENSNTRSSLKGKLEMRNNTRDNLELDKACQRNASTDERKVTEKRPPLMKNNL